MISFARGSLACAASTVYEAFVTLLAKLVSSILKTKTSLKNCQIEVNTALAGVDNKNARPKPLQVTEDRHSGKVILVSRKERL